jgi:hypothetical protein
MLARKLRKDRREKEEVECERTNKEKNKGKVKRVKQI